MENHEKNIDDVFREALGNQAETPPPAIWANLESRLAAVRTPGMFKTRTIWYIAMCIIALITIPVINTLRSGSGLNSNIAPGNAELNANSESTTNKVTGTSQNNSNNNLSRTNDKQIQSNIPAQNDKENNRIPDNKSKTAGIAFSIQQNSNGNSSIERQRKNNERHLTNLGSANSAHSFSTKGAQVSNSETNVVNDNDISKHTGATKSGPNNYGSNLSKPGLVEEIANLETEAKKNEPQTKKTNAITLTKNKLSGNKQNKSPQPKFNKLDAGIKVGYERAFDNTGGRKAVISPYIQYNISPKISVMLQPAIKFAALDERKIGNSATYYKQNSDSTAIQTGPSTKLTLPEDSLLNLYVTKFRYSQSHDSIVKTNIFGRPYIEAEVPVLLKYKVAKGLSVFGGVNIIYSKTIAIKENTATYTHISQTVDTFIVTPYVNPAPPYSASSLFNYSGADISQYHGPQYPATTKDDWRIGYMLGFSYQFYNRWMFDALIQQSNAKANVQGKYNTNTPFSVPYFRLTLGYNIISR